MRVHNEVRNIAVLEHRDPSHCVGRSALCPGQIQDGAARQSHSDAHREEDLQIQRSQQRNGVCPVCTDEIRQIQITPLMIALHGLTSNPQQIMRYPGLTDLAEKNGYIVAAPYGYNDRGWYGQAPPFGRKPDPE